MVNIHKWVITVMVSKIAVIIMVKAEKWVINMIIGKDDMIIII